MMKVIFTIALLSAAYFGASGAVAADAVFDARVIHVADGDTVTVLDAKKREIIIRLAEIDAPENGQPWSEKSKQHLKALLHGQIVSVSPIIKDRYGRTVAALGVRGEDLSEAMVRSGDAWAFRQYLIHEALISIEAEARAAKRGLWSMPDDQIVPPWEWRARRRAAIATPSDESCGPKRYCREMTSCSEAKRYLTSCGLYSLDGDGDGVPCESLCDPRK